MLAKLLGREVLELHLRLAQLDHPIHPRLDALSHKIVSRRHGVGHFQFDCLRRLSRRDTGSTARSASVAATITKGRARVRTFIMKPPFSDSCYFALQRH